MCKSIRSILLILHNCLMCISKMVLQIHVYNNIINIFMDIVDFYKKVSVC